MVLCTDIYKWNKSRPIVFCVCNYGEYLIVTFCMRCEEMCFRFQECMLRVNFEENPIKDCQHRQQAFKSLHKAEIQISP